MRLYDLESVYCKDCEFKDRCSEIDCDVHQMPVYNIPDVAKHGVWKLKKEDCIDNTPAIDAVPVVRCRACRYYQIGEDCLPYCICPDGGISDYPCEDDFCSYGERKGGDE